MNTKSNVFLTIWIEKSLIDMGIDKKQTKRPAFTSLFV